jgi:hypothetical protein
MNLIGQVFYRIWRVPKKSGNLGNQLNEEEVKRVHFKESAISVKATALEDTACGR